MKYKKGDLIKYFDEIMLITKIDINSSCGFVSTNYIMFNLTSKNPLKYHDYATSHIDHFGRKLE
jgi:hypothetical protein